MFFESLTDLRPTVCARRPSRFAISLLLTSLLAGCGELGSSPATSNASSPASSTASKLTLVSAAELLELPPIADPEALTPTTTPTTDDSTDDSGPYWSFPKTVAKRPLLTLLPPVDDLVEQLQEVPQAEDASLSFEEPQPLPALPSSRRQPTAGQIASLPVTSSPEELSEPEVSLDPEASIAAAPQQTEMGPEDIVELLLQDSSPVTTGVLTNSRIQEQAKLKIQHAYSMARRGGLFLARKELIEVLRMISQAKDAQQGTPEHSQALAAGLRALREAKDFEPYGTQLEAELDIHVLCASHRTPIAQREDAENLLPRLMMDRYLRYAQLQLAWSVAGEPTGSMALHALGKLNSRLARVEPDNHRLADRYAIAYQQAALLAHNQNYLATHELGVLLAASGHLEESQRLLQDVSRRSPNAIVYQNLAYVQEKLGQPNAAGANRNYAQQLRQQGMTGTHGVRWVAPEEFVQSPAFPAKPPTAPTASPSPRLAMAPMHPAARPPQQGPTPVRVLPGARQAPMTTLTR